MIAERVPHAPQLVQVAGQRAGGLDDDIAPARGLLDGADDLRLARQVGPVGASGGVDHGVPVGLLPPDALRVPGGTR